MATTVTSTESLQDPEPWDYLARHAARKSSLLTTVTSITAACPKDPGHAHTPASDCKLCHRKIVDAISARYLSSPESEWYADRRTFLQHLAEIFPAVKRGEVDASGIENRVMEEKRRWFKESVRKIAVTMGGAGMGEVRDELLRLVDDRGLKFEDFCERVQDVIGRGIKADIPTGSLDKLVAVGSDRAARAQAYKDVFFLPSTEGGEFTESTRKYLEMLEQGMPMSKVVCNMLEDTKRGMKDKAELDRLHNRIEVLKIAKDTWLAQRKKGEQQEPDWKFECSNCGNMPEQVDPPSCAVCQIGFMYGLWDEPVVYCSEECQRLSHDKHVEEDHKCAAGEHCTTLYLPGDGEKGNTSDDTGNAYICKECLDREDVTVFCSLACAEAEKLHHSDRRPGYECSRDLKQLVTLEQALRDLQDKDLVDKFKILPRLPPVAAPLKLQIPDANEHHMDIDRPDDHAESEHTDHMDMDGANAKSPKHSPNGTARENSVPVRHDDERPAAPGNTQRGGAQPAPKPPTPDHNPDTEMTDAGVDSTDFAGQPDPAPRGESAAPATAESSSAQPMTGPASTDDITNPSQPADERPPSPSASQPPPKPSDSPVNPAEHLPLNSPRSSAAMKRTSTTIVSSPNRVTSIQPMPSLGRSLEVQITKVPAEFEAGASRDDTSTPQRHRDVAEMDRIADARLERVSETAGEMGLDDDGAEGRRRREGSLLTGGHETDARRQDGEEDVETEERAGGVPHGGKSPAYWEAASNPVHLARAEQKDSKSPSHHPSDPENVLFHPASRSQQPPPPSKDNSQKSLSDDSREEGEVSDDGSRKRKASMEPGEVDEDEEDGGNNSIRNGENGGGRDAKKSRSEEGVGIR